MSEWLTSFEAVEELKRANFNDPMTLAIWAAEGVVRTCARTMKCDGKIEAEMSGSPEILPGFWHYIRLGSNSSANWQAGVFRARLIYELDEWNEHPEHTWDMQGVSFHAKDIAKQVELAKGGPSCVAIDDPRGVLPSHAQPNDRKHEEAAHQAARIVREEKVKLSEALRRVSADHPDENRAPESVQRATRQAFGLMYHPDGTPIQIDQD